MPDPTGLAALPAHPDDVAWPTAGWTTGPGRPGWDLDGWVGELFDDPDAGTTYAVAVAHRGRLVYERYGGALEHWDRPAEPVGPSTALHSWSVAKSVLHCAVGILVGEGRLDPTAPAAVPEWAGDERSAITLDDLLTMRSGLDWVEDYDAGSERSDVIEMLFGGGISDTGHFAADRRLATAPGAAYLYSSGTSNVISRIVADTVGPGAAYESWLRERLLDPIGMSGARLTFDEAGTWIASSYLYATATEWLRFGELVLRDGVWEDRRLLPPGWVDHGRTPRSADEEPLWHCAHWWSDRHRSGSWQAEGYEGQMVMAVPALDAVVVRFGKSPVGSPVVWDWQRTLLDRMSAAPD